jgi:hypothetical protein
MKTIQDMKNELRATLLITDENKRPETLMRLTLLWGLSENMISPKVRFTTQ